MISKHVQRNIIIFPSETKGREAETYEIVAQIILIVADVFDNRVVFLIGLHTKPLASSCGVFWTRLESLLAAMGLC